MASPARSGGSLTDVAGLSVGHAQRIGEGWLSGTTVVLAPPGGVVTAVDVRGGGPATRETDALVPGTLVERIEAVVLTGGSAYGLDAAAGVVRWLEEQHRGFPVGPAPHEVVPVVPAAALFDLGRGGEFAARPDAALGYAAAQAAAAARASGVGGATAAALGLAGSSGVGSVGDGSLDAGSVGAGSVGAGTGAVAGGLKGGTGEASTTLPDGTVVAALVVVNAAGSPLDLRTGALLGASWGEPGEFPESPAADEHAAALATLAAQAPAGSPLAATPPLNTTIGVVATTAALTREEARRLASASHDGLARALRPVHTLFDGDTLFAMATGTHPLPATADAPGVAVRAAAVAAVQAAGADVVARAVAHAVLAAEGTRDIPTYRDLYPRATASLPSR